MVLAFAVFVDMSASLPKVADSVCPAVFGLIASSLARIPACMLHPSEQVRVVETRLAGGLFSVLKISRLSNGEAKIS